MFIVSLYHELLVKSVNVLNSWYDIYLTSYLTCLKVGIGMSMEGIEQNPVVYDLMSEMAFQHEKVDVKVISDFCV